MILILKILLLIASLFLSCIGSADLGKLRRRDKDGEVKPRRPILPRPLREDEGWRGTVDVIGADECDPAKHSVDLPSEIRAWYRNPDGSCVQCSIGMCGVDQNVPSAALLLWDSADYGPKERGGSYPQRVANYAQKRGMRIFNITGEANTFAWMKWACKTGRGCAIGAGGSHFQTLFGYEPQAGRWYVCNNNSTSKIDVYDEAGFRRLHMASGPWVVVLDAPPHPQRPEYVAWWE